MRTFLQSLLTTGHPLVDPGKVKVEQWIKDELAHPPETLHQLLEPLHKQESLSFPGPPPRYHPEAALWALQYFFQGIMLLPLSRNRSL